VVIFEYVGDGTNFTRFALTVAGAPVVPNAVTRSPWHRFDWESTTPSMSTGVTDYSYIFVFFLFAA